MSLYLAVFASDNADDELDGIDLGSYADFGALRSIICEALEDRAWGSRFPTFMLVPDDGPIWASAALPSLAHEVDAIRHDLAEHPPVAFASGTWQAEVARREGVRPASLADCLIDVDGEPLLERLAALVAIARAHDRPIEFQ